MTYCEKLALKLTQTKIKGNSVLTLYKPAHVLHHWIKTEGTLVSRQAWEFYFYVINNSNQLSVLLML